MLSSVFVDRPRLAIVIAIVTVVAFFLIFMVLQTTGLIGKLDEFMEAYLRWQRAESLGG